MNGIALRQNQPEQLRLRKASRATYDLAQNLVVVQAVLIVGAPTLGALVALRWPDLRPWVAAFALLVVLIDALGLERWQKSLLKLGAKIGEKFDCTVLEMPWDSFTVGDEPEPEDMRTAEARWERSRRTGAFENWYPVSVAAAPIHLARIMCQRTNLRYDSNLRRSYATILRITAVVVPVFLLLITARFTNKLTDFLLLLVTVTPLVAWCCREAYRQADTAGALENLMKQARKLWSDALAGNCGEDHCEARARDLQTAIFNRRATATPILPGVYGGRRARLEDEMIAGAADFIAQYNATLVERG